MNRFKMLCLMMLASLTAFAQNKITGRVIKGNSSPIVAANVKVVGTAIQVYSNARGDFTIPIPNSLADREIVLFVSKTGYSSTRKVIRDEYRQGRPVIIMLRMISAPPPPRPSAESDEHADQAAPPESRSDQVPVPRFPWPPPEYSVSAVLNKNYFRQSRTLSDVDKILTAALSNLGYDDRSYFEIPNGFALVTRIEQIREDGSPFIAPARWSVRIRAYDHLSWSSYLRALVFPPRGFFRIIVFAVTDNAFTSSHERATRTDAERWLRAGLTLLPASIGNRSFGPNHQCTALIYQFKKVEANEARQITGDLTGMEHLKNAGLIPLVKSQ
jgi:hypothetical protein